MSRKVAFHLFLNKIRELAIEHKDIKINLMTMLYFFLTKNRILICKYIKIILLYFSEILNTNQSLKWICKQIKIKLIRINNKRNINIIIARIVVIKFRRITVSYRSK